MDTEKIIEKMIDKSIVIVKNDFIKKKIQLMIIQPFLQYILEDVLVELNIYNLHYRTSNLQVELLDIYSTL